VPDELVNVRYMVDDVESAVAFYTNHFGFTLRMSAAPAFADVVRGNLRLLLSGPKSSAGRPMPDGRVPEPGGWNRIHFIVDDIAAEVERLRSAGLTFRNDIISGPGGQQILLEDPAGNPIELFQPAEAPAPQLETNVLLHGEEAGGHVSLTEIVVPPNAGPPLHTHDFDEAFYMLEGELIFQVEDALDTKRAGEISFAPRNVAHALANHSDAPARYVLVCTPAGFERHWARMAAEAAGVEPPEWALQPIPEVTVVGPPISA
jgi:quercetin dioxygenase-like cupin family protein/catechol 2,3-dioxygenase-like lactoylglutathione lyase family enzyme